MDDINFDELDKAVNSALRQTNSPQPPTAQPLASSSVSTTSSDNQPQPGATDDQTQPSVEQAEEPTTPTSTPSIVVPKRRGQFMDVVHPSSDMTSVQASATRPFVKRSTTRLQPLDPSVIEASVRDTTLAPASTVPSAASTVASTDTPEEEVAQPVLAEPVAPQSEWPDPIDIAPQSPETDEITDATPQNLAAPDAESQQEPAPAFLEESPLEAGAETSNEPSETTAQPLAVQPTPFIEGTEIEKRPLGAFTGNPDEPEAVSEQTLDTVAETDDAAPLSPQSPQPEELSPELVSVESDDVAKPFESAAPVSEPSPSSTAFPVSDIAMTTSIPAQYTPQPITESDEDTHPVFDTKEYHQPLLPPVKHASKKTALILGLTFLVLLGIAAWYGIWVLKLI